MFKHDELTIPLQETEYLSAFAQVHRSWVDLDVDGAAEGLGVGGGCCCCCRSMAGERGGGLMGGHCSLSLRLIYRIEEGEVRESFVFFWFGRFVVS